jgi:SAM-dependent MidA family methyltransferase
MSSSSFLQQLVRDAGGVVPFHRFMEWALYHPQQGYYMGSRARIGRSGDFVTAPEMSSLFGELLTLEWISVWQQMGSPDRFTVVEIGGGNGRLMADAWCTARKFPRFLQALEWIACERSPDFVSRQRQALDASGNREVNCRWVDGIDALADDSIVGILFSNELFDALPVHWLEVTAGGVRELGVALEDGNWRRVWLDLPLPAGLAPWVAAHGSRLEVGTQAEVGLAGEALMQQLGRKLRYGIVMTIDYGYPDGELYAVARTAGTLVGFRTHQQVNDPLEFPAAMDLTAHVDFTALARAGESVGLHSLGFTTQGWYLLGLGILQRMGQITAGVDQATADGTQSVTLLRQTVMRLILPEAMGERFKVLVQGRGMDTVALAGFSLDNRMDRLWAVAEESGEHGHTAG